MPNYDTLYIYIKAQPVGLWQTSTVRDDLRMDHYYEIIRFCGGNRAKRSSTYNL